MTEPSIIRHDALHEVKVTEGSQVAASNSLDPQAPQVRRTLAGEEAEDSLDTSTGVVFERSTAAPEEMLQAPPSLARPEDAPSIVIEHAIHDGERLHVEAGIPGEAQAASSIPERATEPPQDGPVFQREESDHYVAVPQQAQSSSEHAQVPELRPHLEDNIQHLPPQDALDDRFVQAPPDGARANGAGLDIPSATQETAPPPLPPVPVAEAQKLIAEIASDIQAKVAEILGSPEPAWVEMDFPARVVKLKIENDKVRTKLEQLESMAKSPMR